MKISLNLPAIVAVLCIAAGAIGSRLSFQEHAAVQESLARVHLGSPS